MSTSPPHQFRLLRERRFAPFFLTQFLGAGNDNVFKNAMALFIVYQIGSVGGLTGAMLVNLAAGLFILPFVLFSATAGQIADKFEKSRLIRFLKLLEIAIMVFGAIGFWQGNVTILFAALFLMGLHSTLFGPVKYAILPQHLREEELVGGNGLVESATFVAILLGTVAGGLLVAIETYGPIISGIACVLIGVAGYLASRGIPPTPAAAPELRINWNPFTETWRNIHTARKTRVVWLGMLGISWFWFYGAIFLSQFPNFTKEILGGNEHVATMLLAFFSIGLGIGALMCEKLSKGRIEPALIFFGAVGLALFAFDAGFASRSLRAETQNGVAAYFESFTHWRIAFDLIMMGVCGGLYTVPLYVLIQVRSDPERRSRIIAANNILNAFLMVLASLTAVGLFALNVTIPQLFMVTAGLTLLVAMMAFGAAPQHVLRCAGWLLTHTFYRIRTRGLENIPETGACILVCNHVSYVDSVILAGIVRRPIRFIIDHRIYKTPLLHWLFKINRTIPVATLKESGALKEQAFALAAQALRDGEVIGIFPEGHLTPDGTIGKFFPGVARIARETSAPVVPMALHGLWGSFFSRAHNGRAMRKLRGIFSKITVQAGPTIAPEALNLKDLREKVVALHHSRH
ncbi:MAG: MFS transporter [Proteobacteria bacterium]|nr:MFS transporter [Pseudomonadota bacterium]